MKILVLSFLLTVGVLLLGAILGNAIVVILKRMWHGAV